MANTQVDTNPSRAPRIARAYERSRRLLVGVVTLPEDDLRRHLLRKAVTATIGCVDARSASDAQSERRCLEHALGAVRAVSRMSNSGEMEASGSEVACEIGTLARRSADEIEAALAC